MEILPLQIGQVRYDPDTEVVAVFPDGQMTEFSTVKKAKDYLRSEVLSNPDCQFAEIHHFNGKKWVNLGGY
jgi:hypothetical protein